MLQFCYNYARSTNCGRAKVLLTQAYNKRKFHCFKDILLQISEGMFCSEHNSYLSKNYNLHHLPLVNHYHKRNSYTLASHWRGLSLSWIISCKIHGKQSDTGAGYTPSFSDFILKIFILPMLLTYPLPSPEVCESSDQKTYYHILQLS